MRDRSFSILSAKSFDFEAIARRLGLLSKVVRISLNVS